MTKKFNEVDICKNKNYYQKQSTIRIVYNNEFYYNT